MSDVIAIGKIVAAHAIKGEVVIHPYNPETTNEFLFNDAIDKQGKAYQIRITGHKKHQLIASIKHITTRNEAEQLRGVELYTKREVLPVLEGDEFYHVDLVGMKALCLDHTHYGTVAAIYNYGAGDILEIALISGKTELFSFVKEVVPEINRKEGYIIVTPPLILNEREEKPL